MKTIDKRAIGKKLYNLRTELGKSRKEVAKEIGISVSAIQMYENGRRIPKDNIKIRLAEYFNATVQEIFFNETTGRDKNES